MAHCKLSWWKCLTQQQHSLGLALLVCNVQRSGLSVQNKTDRLDEHQLASASTAHTQ